MDSSNATLGYLNALAISIEVTVRLTPPADRARSARTEHAYPLGGLTMSGVAMIDAPAWPRGRHTRRSPSRFQRIPKRQRRLDNRMRPDTRRGDHAEHLDAGRTERTRHEEVPHRSVGPRRRLRAEADCQRISKPSTRCNALVYSDRAAARNIFAL